MSPEKIHQMGIDEVARISARMKAEVFEVLGHTGSIAELGRRLQQDPKNQFKDKEELVQAFEAVLQKINGFLPDLFETLPAAQLQVKPVDDSGIPVYIAGTVDGARPGMTYIPTEPIEQQPRYEQPVYALHEGIPGHHLQNSLALEVCHLLPSRLPALSLFTEPGYSKLSEDLGGKKI